MTSTAVRVGLRVRPLTKKEQINNCTECLSFIPNEPQILIGTDKSFTYDYVFGTDADQAQVYLNAASPLLHKFIDGFNATILAYGQTGSGKTFSMGTSLDNSVSAENEGIVPRCILELFQILKAREAQDQDYKYEIYVSFLELYNEEFIDLLNNTNQSKRRSTSSQQSLNNATGNSSNEVSVREDVAGNIYWSGVKEELCYSPEELLGFLAQGSLGRTTGSTEMNSVSSRSHAIFSVILKQQKPEDDEDGKRVIRSLTSKFHFVDLAGSERLKRTHAQGDRAKEGIAINSGLLALGNVISALGDETRRATHIPYRDSKLTRLLQDSLGGNSQTLMLACVSPADTNFMETLNTLKYANRARNIKNRVTVNQDFAGSSMEVNQLKALVSRLRMEIASLRASPSTDGSTTLNTNTNATNATAAAMNITHNIEEISRLRERINDMSSRIIQVTSERDTLLMERELGEFMQNDNTEDEDDLLGSVNTTDKKIMTHPIIENYLKTIQELTTELNDTKDKLQGVESQNLQLQKTASLLQRFSTSQTTSNSSKKRNNHRSGARTSANNSSTTSGYAARITTKVTARRPILTKSTSTSSRNANRQKKHVRIKQPSTCYRYKQNDVNDDEYEDEGYVNDLQEDDVRHEEVKESIAKVRADIRKSLQVLELVKPLDDTTNSWEEELKAFEAEEKRLHDCKELQRAPSDEGRFSLTPSPTEEYIHAIETLAVPNWENVDEHNNARAGSSFASNEEEEETAATEFDDDIISIKSNTTAATSEHQTKYNSQLSRMLHQIQSDIKVKEELVSHLEKSETEFTFMRKKFDEKINFLQSQLADTQKEKDLAMMRTKSGLAIRSDITNHQMQQQQQSRTNAANDKDIRQAYETKMKNLMTEIQDLRRKYAHATSAMQSSRNQNEALLRTLKVNVETLKTEKKRLVHRMKLEADRVREQMSKQERRIQQLQRQHAKSNQAKLRLEREHEQQKTTLKKRNEEILINASQVKQLTAIMKKAVREGGILDEKMLSKVTPIMGGSFAVIARGGGHGFPRRPNKRKNPIPLSIRVTRKKELLDKALYQYIQGKQAVVEMEQLLIRRERLVEEKLELEEERDQVYHVEKEHEEITGQPMDTIAIELMDERIDLISAEISYLSARIRTLQSEAAEEAIQAEESGAHVVKNSSPRPPKHVTFADEIITEPIVANDDWADMDTFDEQFSVPVNAAPEMAYDITSKLIKSFESDECKRIIENLVDDIMDLRMSECNRQLTVQNLEKTVIDLRRTLIVMKRAAISSTAESERRIRHLKTGDNSVIGMFLNGIEDNDDAHSIDEYMNNGNTIFDRIYEDGVRGLIKEAPMMSASPPSDLMLYTPKEQQQQPSLPNSPVASPLYPSANAAGNSNKPPLPVQMTESISKNTALPRECTPSPDRFYNMIQKRLSWQTRVSGDETLAEEDQLLRAAAAVAEAATTAAAAAATITTTTTTTTSPPDFGHYITDHDSSTSSIRSSHLRRSSIQSDMSSLSSWNQKSMNRMSSGSNINATGSLQNNNNNNNNNSRRPQPQQRSMPPPPPPMSPLLSHIPPSHEDFQYQQSPLFTTSYQQQRFTRRPLPSLIPSVSTFERPTTPSVFDRLAQTPTRASRAKMNYRHSSSSVDDLRKRWELDQQQQQQQPQMHQQRSSSVMSGNYV